MSCFLSEILFPENSDGLPWSCCRRCRRREQCPCVYDQALYRAADQGRAAARLLTEKTDQLLETISRADDGLCLLNADETMERALSQALCSEVTLIRDLCVRMQ